MEIKAKCKFDEDSIRALFYVSMHKKRDPKKAAITTTVLCLALFLLIVVSIIFLGFDLYSVCLLVSDMLIMGMFLYSYLILPKLQYKRMGKMKDAENDFVFYENTLKMATKNEVYSGESEIEYHLFVKVYETSRYFFLFQPNNTAIIVDKSTIEGGTAEDIRAKLTSVLNEKYVVCKY